MDRNAYGSSSAEFVPEDKRHERRRRQRAFLLFAGIQAFPTDGNPQRPSRRPKRMREYRRRYYLRLKAEALGITLEQAELLTPRRPRPAFRGGNARVPRRDVLGRFLPGRVPGTRRLMKSHSDASTEVRTAT